MKTWRRAMLLPFAGGPNPLAYTNKVLALSPIAYWPLAEAAGATVAVDATGNGRNGAYTAVTLGQTGIGDGRTAASFDGSTSFVNIFSASLAAAFNGAEGTFSQWVKVSGAGVWTDATTRRSLQLQADASNLVRNGRSTVNNQMVGAYTAAATTKSVTVTTAGPAGYVHWALTWSKSADQMILYMNGTQQGVTQTGLGIYAGSLAATLTVIGAASTVPASVWSGFIAHTAVWSSALSAAQIATLAVVP